MMGGRIWVESELGQGSTFHFTVRFGVAAAATRSNLADETVGAAARHAHAGRRRQRHQPPPGRAAPAQLADASRRRGRRRRGPRALLRARAAGAPFPLVLIDGRMPEMDGFALAARIKEDPTLTGSTVLMLTSDDRPGDLARCRELGIAAYLVKPIRSPSCSTRSSPPWARRRARRPPAPAPAAGGVPRPAARCACCWPRTTRSISAWPCACSRSAGIASPWSDNGREAVAAAIAAAVRPRPDGRADAGDGRLRGHRRAPRRGARHRPATCRSSP